MWYVVPKVLIFMGAHPLFSSFYVKNINQKLPQFCYLGLVNRIHFFCLARHVGSLENILLEFYVIIVHVFDNGKFLVVDNTLPNLEFSYVQSLEGHEFCHQLFVENMFLIPFHVQPRMPLRTITLKCQLCSPSSLPFWNVVLVTLVETKHNQTIPKTLCIVEACWFDVCLKFENNYVFSKQIVYRGHTDVIF